jgi:hypothetical protein
MRGTASSHTFSAAIQFGVSAISFSFFKITTGAMPSIKIEGNLQPNKERKK